MTKKESLLLSLLHCLQIAEGSSGGERPEHCLWSQGVLGASLPPSVPGWRGNPWKVLALHLKHIKHTLNSAISILSGLKQHMSLNLFWITEALS